MGIIVFEKNAIATDLRKDKICLYLFLNCYFLSMTCRVLALGCETDDLFQDLTSIGSSRSDSCIIIHYNYSYVYEIFRLPLELVDL